MLSTSIQNSRLRRRILLVGALGLTASFGQTAFGQTAKPIPLQLEVPSVVQRSQFVGHKNPADVVNLSINLQAPNATAMQAFADSVSNPTSPNFRQFITPTEFGERFGQPKLKFRSVVAYFRDRGFDVKLAAPNRLNILISGTVAQTESALDTTINNYHAQPTEPGRMDFYSYAQSPSLPSDIAPLVQSIGGLENFTKPVPRALTVTQTRTLYNIASYYSGGMKGDNRTVAISSWDGFRLSNLQPFYQQFGLPTPVGGVGSNVKVVTVGGGSGSGSPGGEGDLDIQMVLGMAPLTNFIIYDGGPDLVSVLTKEANDNSADIISESYGWNLSAANATSAHNLHVQMTAQGITYMAATGDYGTTLEPYSYPNYEPEVLQVGGTIASVDATGKRTGEVGWSGSGGGWSTNTASFNVRPSWQTGSGVPNVNYRLGPDLSLNASGNNTGAYQFYYNGVLTSDYEGTSFASPVFAGMLAVGQQKLISVGGLPANSAGKRRMGRIQDVIYGQKMRSDVWTDITVGANGNLPNGQASNAGAGWDYVTGLGVMDMGAFIGSQKLPVLQVVSPTSASVYQGQNASGSSANLVATDGSYYTVDSVYVPNLGAVAAAQVSFTLPDKASSLAGLTLKVASSAPHYATSFVYALNVNTGAYDLISSTTASDTTSTVTIPVKNFANYVSGTNTVRVIVRDVYPTRVSGTLFTLRLDSATLTESK